MDDLPLPEEILTEIFSRIPTKSVGKLRCLSKTWRTRLTTSHFVDLHFSREAHKENLILITPAKSIHTINHPIKDDAVSKKLDLQNTWTQVAGSCNGLVLLSNPTDEMLLVNPITLEQVKVPNLSLAPNKVAILRGFGYDSSTNDYKIVILSYYTENEHDVRRFYTLVDVYSVKLCVWKRVSGFPNYDISVSSYGAFTNGAIHWFSNGRISGSPSVIVAFDLAAEVFREIPCPVNIGRRAFRRLFVLEGCLCLVDYLSSGSIDVWKMKEYGVADSWTKFNVDAKRCDVDVPLCYTRDKEIVLVTFDMVLVLCNLHQGTTKDMVVNGIPAYFIDGVTFVDSLVSPNQHASSS